MNKAQKNFLKGLALMGYIFLILVSMLGALIENTVFWNVAAFVLLVSFLVAIYIKIGKEE